MMIDIIKKDIIAIFDECLELFNKKEINITKFAKISNKTIHNASVFQDQDSIKSAVIIYSIFKILERASSEEFPTIINRVKPMVQEMRAFLERGDFKEYEKKVKAVLKTLSDMDDRLKFFIEDVIEKAKIKKGGMIYEHGVSIARAAELMGITQWELMNYLGKTEIADTEIAIKNVKDRIMLAKKLFKIKTK